VHQNTVAGLLIIHGLPLIEKKNRLGHTASI
jgi:hypothetical protein